MATDRVPRIGLPSDYYGNFGIRTIPNQTNDPGFPGLFPSKTMNPLTPVVRMPAPSNEAALQRARVADASGGWADFYSSVGIGRTPAAEAAARSNYGPLTPGEVEAIYKGIFGTPTAELTTR